ncbi:hypothetical protein, partial [Streptomyces sp. NPDC058953]|uniref:hypothetical protein n=1 Tax=Streptomyces sp. NPDC058953 TaxID=3346676 RepID=UPI0036805D6E
MTSGFRYGSRARAVEGPGRRLIVPRHAGPAPYGARPRSRGAYRTARIPALPVEEGDQLRLLVRQMGLQLGGEPVDVGEGGEGVGGGLGDGTP